MDSDDPQLVASIVAGGEPARQAMATLFERHFRPLCRSYRYAFPSLSEDDVADAVSSCMLKAFENARSYRGQAGVRTWIGAMVRNRILDQLRSQKGNTPAVYDDEADCSLSEIASAHPSPLTEVELERLNQCVRSRFEVFRCKYPEAAAAIFERFVEETDFHELAGLLGRTYGATRQFVSKEVARLREYLEPCLEYLRA